MRNPLNKAMTISNQIVKPVEGDPMNPVLRSVADLTAKIDTSDASKRQEYAESLRKLEAEKDRIIAARDAADSEEEYDRTDADLQRITDKIRFFERQIYKIDHTARLSEEEYNRAVMDIDCLIREAAAHCANETEKAFEKLSESKTAYNKLLRDADKALSDLDRAANYLQSKFTHRITQYSTEEPGVYREVATFDPNEWTNHARRYGNGRGYDYLKMAPKAHRLWTDAEDRSKERRSY